jgi:Ca2+-binding RTX toxin-like protein
MLPNVSGAHLTKIALDPNGATAIDGNKTSQISIGTVNQSMDHPRMAASPARDQVVVSFLAEPGPDYLRTVMKQSDGTWSVVPTSLQSIPGSFTFPRMTFDPDGNLYLVFYGGTSGFRVHKYAWQNNDWTLLQQSSLPIPSGFRVQRTTFWDLPNSTDFMPVDSTPALAIDRIGNAQQPIFYIAYTLWDTKGTTTTDDDEPRVLLTAANVNDVTQWMTPKVLTTSISTFAPGLSFAGKANVVDVLVHELDASQSDPAVVMRQRRYWASDFGHEQASLEVGASSKVSEMPTRSPRTERDVFFGEYQGLTGKGRLSITAVPTHVGASSSGDADLYIATVNDRCQNTVRELTSGSHPDTVWDCDCNCGGSQANLMGCVPASVSSATTACAGICQGSDCGMALSCPPGRQCTPVGTGRVKLGTACQDTYGPWIGPPPSLFADYYAEATTGSIAQFVLNGDGAQTSLGGSVALNVAAIPPAAGTQIEVSRLDLRPASFGVGGFLGATIRDIRLVHVERFYGTFIDAQHFTIPAHTAELVARLVIDPDGPDWLTGDPATKTLGIDNDAAIKGELDLAANTITLTIVAGGGGNSVNATFVGAIKTAPVDSDGDGIVDSIDNCPQLYNPDQTDAPPVFGPLGSSLLPRCTAGEQVTIPFPAATDACTPNEVDVAGVIVALNGMPLASPIVLSHAPATLPSGILDVEWTATDGNGHHSTVHQLVEVVTGPFFTVVPPDFTTSSCRGVNVGTAFAQDTCPGTVSMTNNAPVKFPLGTTIVTHTATDQQGNVRTATQRVTVLLGDDPSCCPTGTHVIVGTPNNDILNGTNGADCILGLGGQDIINGGEGDDFISGGDGDDTISGGPGNDFINGGSGQDVINGNDGDDTIYGGDGDDTLIGGAGNDILHGGQGQDQLQGQDGNDQLFGEDGSDNLQGEAGNDNLAGGAGTDTCDGGAGSNTFELCELGAPNSCADGVQNGTETGLDCGGG